MIVADASAVVEFLLGTGVGMRVEEELAAHGEIHAPSLLDVEVVRVLRRLERRGAMGSAHGSALIEILQDMPVSRHPMDPLLPRIWQWRDNLNVYDAAYVALAEALECAVVTLDGRIAGAVGTMVEVVRPR